MVTFKLSCVRCVAGFTPNKFDSLFDGLKPSEITAAQMVDRARVSGADVHTAAGHKARSFTTSNAAKLQAGKFIGGTTKQCGGGGGGRPTWPRPVVAMGQLCRLLLRPLAQIWWQRCLSLEGR